MSKIFFFALFMCTAMFFAQSNKNVESHHLKVDFLTPGLVYETGISKNSTLRAEATSVFGFGLGPQDNFGIFPLFDTQYRYYYNFNRRFSKDKRTNNNTANFVGLQCYYLSSTPLIGELDPSLLSVILFGPAGFDVFYAGPAYGMQRTFKPGLNLELQLGIGYIEVRDGDHKTVNLRSSSGIYPNFNLGLGWVINSHGK